MANVSAVETGGVGDELVDLDAVPHRGHEQLGPREVAGARAAVHPHEPAVRAVQHAQHVVQRRAGQVHRVAQPARRHQRAQLAASDQPLQPGQGVTAHRGIVLPDSGGEGDDIGAPQHREIAADVLAQPVDIDLICQPRLLVPAVDAFVEFAEVGLTAESVHARATVEHRLDVLDAHLRRPPQIHDDALPAALSLAGTVQITICFIVKQIVILMRALYPRKMTFQEHIVHNWRICRITVP